MARANTLPSLSQHLFSVREAAEILHVSEKTARIMVSSGQLAHTRVRRQIRISRRSLFEMAGLLPKPIPAVDGKTAAAGSDL